MTGFISRPFFRWVSGSTTIPVTLGLRNIYILPTGYGVIYLAVLVAMLIGSINYNNNLGFLLTFLLGSLALTAMLHTYGMLYGLYLKTAMSTPVFAGERMEVEIVISNINRARTGLRLFFNLNHPVDADLSPGGPARVQVPAVTARRGWFSPPRLRIACDYPLGLFRAWARINTEVQEIIYPQPFAAPAPGTESRADHGDGSIIPAMGTDDFQGLNAYQPGDSPRRIHWQAYSRGRGLHTKHFAGQASTGMMLDMERIKGADVETTLSVLCFHVLRVHHLRVNFGLKLIGQVIPPDSGTVHRNQCLRALALYGRR